MEQQYQKMIAQGRCRTCCKPNPTLEFTRCPECRVKENDRARVRRTRDPERHRQQVYASNQRLKEEAFRRYGACCACCGDSYEPYLEFDHIDGGGHAHRKSLSSNGLTAVLQDMKKRGWPPILQVLCANCHRAKTSKKLCHHSS